MRHGKQLDKHLFIELHSAYRSDNFLYENIRTCRDQNGRGTNVVNYCTDVIKYII